MALLPLSRELFQRVESLFLIECDGKQDGLHRIVTALVGGCLRVGADTQEQAVEVLLILTAQRTAKFHPAQFRLLNELTKSRYGATQ